MRNNFFNIVFYVFIQFCLYIVNTYRNNKILVGTEAYNLYSKKNELSLHLVFHGKDKHQDILMTSELY